MSYLPLPLPLPLSLLPLSDFLQTTYAWPQPREEQFLWCFDVKFRRFFDYDGQRGGGVDLVALQHCVHAHLGGGEG